MQKAIISPNKEYDFNVWMAPKPQKEPFLISQPFLLSYKKDILQFYRSKIKYTNRYTIGDLFPDEDPLVAIKRELRTIEAEDYIHTVKDKRYRNKADLRVFGKVYHNGDVYIKIRVELLTASQNELGDYIFVMSFHYSTIDFVNICFPYKKDGRYGL